MAKDTEVKNIVLSHYFDENTVLVAGMCSKCYAEQTELRITAVNRILLIQAEKRKRKKQQDEQTVNKKKLLLNKLEENIIKARSLELSQKQIETNVETIIKNKTNTIKTEMDGVNKPKCNTSKIRKRKTKTLEKKLLKIKSKKEEDIDLTPSQQSLWDPPQSPHNLIEESLYKNPWGLLVATIFLNKTQCMYARPFITKFLEEYPSPDMVLEKKPKDLEVFFESIGLKKRALQVWRMSYDFLYKKWRNAKELYGIGKYGEDAYRMFCLGDLNVQPKDRFLKIYQAWYKMLEGKQDSGFFENANDEDDESYK